MRDGDKAHYMGKGVKNAVDNVNNIIAPALIAKQLNVTEQTLIDNFMLELDGTENKSKLGRFDCKTTLLVFAIFLCNV